MTAPEQETAADIDELDDMVDDDETTSRGGLDLGQSLDPDAILDALVPKSIDWRGTVRRHPLISVTALGLVGYLVGRSKGAAIMAGVSAGLSGTLMRQLGDVFEGDLFDFD